MTKKQKAREHIARLCEQIIKPCQTAKQLRATNRRVDKRKGRSTHE